MEWWRSRRSAGENGGGEAPAIPLWIVLVACALAAAVLDDAAVLFHRHILDDITRTSPHVYWMSAAANLLLLAPIALVLAAFALARRRRPPVSVEVGILATIAAFGLLGILEGLHPIGAALLAAGIGAATHRFMGRLRRPDVAIFRTAGALTVLFSSVAIASFGVAAIREAARHRELPPAPDTERPDVVLLILDTVRAHSTSLLGPGGAPTPNLDRFASGAVTFERAYSTSPWTLPSHASMFTGRYPHETRTGFYRALDETHPTLAEVLGEAGYVSAGFVANTNYASRSFGLDRGFEHYEDYRVSLGQILVSSALGRRITSSTALRRFFGWHQLVNRIHAPEIQRAFLDWLGRRDPDRPYFAFLNLYDAHEPYLPEEPWDELFGPEPIDRPLWHYSSLLDGPEARRPNDWLEKPGPSERDLRAYEGAIAMLDASLGPFFEELELRGELENTIFVITADHGELVGEHGLFYHWNSLYEPVLHVPLIVRLPGGRDAGVRIARSTSLVDLPATILELAGVDGAAQIPGTPFLGEGATPEEPAERVALSELANGPTFSGTLGRYHYIVNPSRRAEELYDLETDPGERDNLAADPELADIKLMLRDLVATEIERPRSGDRMDAGGGLP